LNLGGEAEIRRYAYDSAGRLARVADGSGGLLESYQYDHEGRRLADINPQRFRGERRYSYNLGDRLGQAGSVQYGHDKSGFRNLKIEGDRETHYLYEPSGLLMAVDLPDGRRIDYAHDAKGQRTQKRVNGRLVEAFRWRDPLRLEEFFDGTRWWRLAYDSERPDLGSRTPVGVTNGDDSYLLLCDQAARRWPLPQRTAMLYRLCNTTASATSCTRGSMRCACRWASQAGSLTPTPA
jgi:YD repeat-containing protein